MAHKKNTTNLTELLLQCVTEMCDGAGSDAEYAGMTVHRAHGGRGGPAARSREKSAHCQHGGTYRVRCG